MVLAGAAAAEENPLREPARAVLERPCGKCHDAKSASAKLAALAIYDLTQIDFAAKMTPAQLQSAMRRLERSAPADDQAIFAQFVSLELARRR